MKERLRKVLTIALDDCFRTGSLDSGQYPEILVETPAHADHGDFATNLAMLLTKAEKKPPRRIAEAIVEALGDAGGFLRRVEIAGPGFINFFLAEDSWFGRLDEILRQGPEFGRNNLGGGRRVQVEFVSANPTGPLHIGHGRGAAVGDALARLLETSGYRVEKEYYINDAGNQVGLLGLSVWMRFRELRGERVSFPEDGYKGEYVREIAQSLLAESEDHVAALEEDQAVAYCSDYGVRAMLGRIEEDLREFGVRFDRWYSEKSLYQRDLVNKELEKLKERNLTFDREGALWLRTTDHGDDKDRVLLRSDGSPTYFASDVAYHMEKFERGFETVIDVWGADHHGYIPRMKAMLAGLGHPPEDLQVLLIQMVNLLREGQPVAMGKRSGEFVTLREVIDEVGRDACRFIFLTRRSDSQLDFDLALAKQQSNDNPVYYVQYAHARVCSINRNAAEQGIDLPAPGKVAWGGLGLTEELDLAKQLAAYPEVVDAAARHFEPHRITFFLQSLAAQFHSYYNRCRVLSEPVELARPRLALMNCARIVLKNGLGILGVSAPERM